MHPTSTTPASPAARLAALVIAAFMLLVPAAVAAEGPMEPLKIAGSKGMHTFHVELARNQQERSRGLMYRRSLAADRGMLFDFGTDRSITMWMKNTYIPLDMIFIGSDHKVSRIAKETTPFSEDTIASGKPARYVLEVPGGTADRLGIRPGAEVSGKAIEGR
ncbi:hypothetical protein CLD20_14870 [Afifella sp. IM 167]|nr:hypothetical protein [Afifella sp. IM 167]